MPGLPEHEEGHFGWECPTCRRAQAPSEPHVGQIGECTRCAAGLPAEVVADKPLRRERDECKVSNRWPVLKLPYGRLKVAGFGTTFDKELMAWCGVKV